MGDASNSPSQGFSTRIGRHHHEVPSFCAASQPAGAELSPGPGPSRCTMSAPCPNRHSRQAASGHHPDPWIAREPDRKTGLRTGAVQYLYGGRPCWKRSPARRLRRTRRAGGRVAVRWQRRDRHGRRAERFGQVDAPALSGRYGAPLGRQDQAGRHAGRHRHGRRAQRVAPQPVRFRPPVRRTGTRTESSGERGASLRGSPAGPAAPRPAAGSRHPEPGRTGHPPTGARRGRSDPPVGAALPGRPAVPGRRTSGTSRPCPLLDRTGGQAQQPPGSPTGRHPAAPRPGRHHAGGVLLGPGHGGPGNPRACSCPSSTARRPTTWPRRPPRRPDAPW